MESLPLAQAVGAAPGVSLVAAGGFDPEAAQLIVLAAGRGTRFGQAPKCVQPVSGVPVAKLTLAAFAPHSATPPLCVIGYEAETVRTALGTRYGYVYSRNPVGGTAWAAYEAILTPGLLAADPLVVVTMGDRIIAEEIFGRLLEAHRVSGRDLTLLSVRARPPANRGKGRVMADRGGRVTRIVEEADIARVADDRERRELEAATLVNCSVYVTRASTACRSLAGVRNDNVQGQYYITDMVAAVVAAGGSVGTVTVEEGEPGHELLFGDVTRPEDLGRVERALRNSSFSEVLGAVRALRADRPEGQTAALAAQVRALAGLDFEPDEPVGLGVAGGRLRIAFMHPDMVRFYGPAWQMPIGSRDAATRHQIVAALQPAHDGVVSLKVLNTSYAGDPPAVPADAPWQYPGCGLGDWHAYERFGTALTREVLRFLGYTEDGPAALASPAGRPPAEHRISSNLHRPFPLVLNAIASIRTVNDDGHLPAVRGALWPPSYRGLRAALDGDIPRGGFSSSSAVTVATINAANALYGLDLPPETIVTVACQAEYGTGVRAGSLDHATQQMGRPTRGAVISSNPRDGYRTLGEFAVPSDTIRILFPFTVDRDVEAWAWSAGCFGSDTEGPVLSTGEYRKLTGKAAEIAAVLIGLPLDVDLFKSMEVSLLRVGRLSAEEQASVARLLLQIPLLISREALAERIAARRDWLAGEIERTRGAASDPRAAAERVVAGLMDGWREPTVHGRPGVPLRAIVGYLYGEVAKNFWLVHHPAEWTASVARSQCGDRWFDVEPERLPPAAEMRRELDWERGLQGPDLMEAWLERHGARPHGYDADIDDATLTSPTPLPPHLWRGTSFFRGLALIDLAEAMLWRAFGREAVAVRVNAAGQGDYFQVHVDTRRADPEDVKGFIRDAVYRRFGLKPTPEFVEVSPGGGAASVRLSAYRRLATLGELLEV